MMKNKIVVLSALFTALCLSDCTCDDGLASAVGEMELALCDRGQSCGCEVLPVQGATIDFGSPAPLSAGLRTLTVRNTNQPRKLTIHRLDVTGGDLFAATSVLRRPSEAADAPSTTIDLKREPLTLEGTELAEITLAFRPSAEGEFAATLTVGSESSTHPNWTVALRGGGGASEICMNDDDCNVGADLDFGTFQDSEIGPDFADALGRPLALGTQTVSVKNTGATQLWVGVELTNDGIPEVPGELPGMAGVFFIGNAGCTVVNPGTTGLIPIEYRPATAGEHHGEVVIKGFGTPRHIALVGRVVGAHLCFRTEDDVPTDGLLQFGNAPNYDTAVNEEPAETRRLWVGNCGYQADLTVSAASAAGTSAPDFTTSALPWTQTTPLAPGGEIEVPVTLVPVAEIGTAVRGRYSFTSNDRLQPTASLDLQARIGPPEQCVLLANPTAVDFGWVASDDAQQGTVCPPPPLPCMGGSAKISRFRELKLTNVGERTCTDIALDTLVADSFSAELFSVDDNPNGPNFSLEPGASSATIRLLFMSDPSDAVSEHVARLPYTSPDMPVSPLSVMLHAKAGGSPHCAVDFQPVAGASFFCPNESLAFGNVNIGQTKTMDLRVINVGSETCNITNVHLTSGTSPNFAVPGANLTIVPGAAGIIPVSFTPVPASGNPLEDLPFNCVNNGLELTANSGAGGANEQHNVSFSGKGKPPSIDVIPGEVEFGLVTVGCCSGERRIAIYNRGLQVLTLDNVGVMGGPGSDFELVRAPADMTLSPNESTDMAVRYCASSEGAAGDVIEIRGHDDNANQEYFAVNASGVGTVDNLGDDRFAQPSRPKVDVLWVVDDSGSMEDDQDALANNFGAFISQATSLNTDYHIGVTNTDGETEWCGRLHACNGNPKYIVDTQPQAQQDSQFRCNVKTVEHADGRPISDNKEAALQAARATFEYPNVDDWNAGFFREDAALYILMVTDEKDQSDGSAQLYIDFFQNLKGLGNPDLLNISAISGPPDGSCQSAEANQIGYDVVNAVGGQFRSLCVSDWSDLIGTLGIDVFHTRRQFPLSRPATANTIEVHLCPSGCPADPTTCPVVPQNNTAGWVFDATLNAISFVGNPGPGPGMCIAVSYLALCYQ